MVPRVVVKRLRGVLGWEGLSKADPEKKVQLQVT